MSTGSFDSSIEGRKEGRKEVGSKEKSRTPCSSRGFCLFVLSVVVLFCYFISISGCSYRRRKNIFVGQSSCIQESKKETVLRLLFFPVDVLIYWYADLETTSMLGSCLILIVYYSSTFFEAQKKKGDHASLNFSIIGIFM